ncbi:MAG: hypothetical protein ACON49_01485 [Candidatus Puniceispirillaceae bacterium]
MASSDVSSQDLLHHDESGVKIKALSSRQRADDYPYEAPSFGYVIKGDRYYLLNEDDMPDLSGRVPVLSVGSNRSPQQLLRKFGQDSYLLVTTAILHDCDVIHSACFSYYGAVPCTAYFSKGTHIPLNAVWLTQEQLQIMHDTEAVGIAYDFCRWDDEKVVIEQAAQPKAVYGYATRLGYVSDSSGNPYALSYLPANGRRFSSLSQLEARAKLRSLLDHDMQAEDEAQFLSQLIKDKGFRLAVNDALAAKAHPINGGPWTILPATTDQADHFL